jgi:hypothetical protein
MNCKWAPADKSENGAILKSHWIASEPALIRTVRNLGNIGAITKTYKIGLCGYTPTTYEAYDRRIYFPMAEGRNKRP